MSDTEGDEIEANIRMRAYLLWEYEGRPEGRAEEYWHRARQRIASEAQAAYPPKQSQANRNSH